MLSGYAKSEWTTVFVIGLLLSAAVCLFGLWWLSIPIILFVLAIAAFFRDPDRRIPTQRSIMVSPADGRISSIHELENFEPFDEPATCIRIFLSVFDVHVNRSPVHGVVDSVTHKPGKHLNAMSPQSAEDNEANLIVLAHPIRRKPVAAVRQVAGLFARTIVCGAKEGVVLQRGQRLGIIKLGSTVELYIPASMNPTVQVEKGQYVWGGQTTLAQVVSNDRPDTAEAHPATQVREKAEAATSDTDSTEQDEAVAAASPEDVAPETTPTSEQSTTASAADAAPDAKDASESLFDTGSSKPTGSAQSTAPQADGQSASEDASGDTPSTPRPQA